MSGPALEASPASLWREQLVRTRELTIPGERSDFYRRVRLGDFVRVTRGAYLPGGVWEALDRDDRYRAIVVSAAEPDTVFSHYSAAVLWRLPWVGPWPTRVHVAQHPARGALSSRTAIRHATGVPSEVAVIDGLRVTGLARTVVDLACLATFEQATAATDAALRRATHPVDGVPPTRLRREDLVAELSRVPLRQGSAKARTVIEFANPLADRPGESVSRVSIHRMRLPAPELQAPLRGRSGRMWHVDFWWPDRSLIGEFDGQWKYTDPRFLRGRTPHQVLLDEKDREDDLRAAGHRFVRWGWDTARSPSRLGDLLLGAGLR